mmetsp:Transcript_12966/g.31783  ORF Transcript_12966/g.31783 Transcript_12966/m.31783 type:complete len:322 (-) Transcript_12966:242-1207(-)
MTTLQQLHDRLTEVEDKLFTPGHFVAAEAECRAILNDSYTKTDKELQACTIILCVQAMFEQKKPPKEVDKFVLEQYGDMLKTPYQVFSIWFQYKLYRRDLRSACDSGIEYLAHNKNVLEQWQYDDFIELLVFHCLTELGEYKRALRFLKRNTFLSHDKKKKYIEDLQRTMHEKAMPTSSSTSTKDRVKHSNATSSLSPEKDEDAKNRNSPRTSTTGAVADGGVLETNGVGEVVGLNGEEKTSALRRKGKHGTRTRLQMFWKKVCFILKRLKQVAPVVFALIFFGILLLLMRNAVGNVKLKRLKVEARKFLSLFFALGPLSG